MQQARTFADIPRIVEEGRFPRLELGEDLVPDCLAAHVEGGWQAFVTVLLGCDNRCSYCIVPDVRGHEYSRPAREVIAEVAALAARGVKEVCLLGQSVLRYGVRNKAWFDDNPILQSFNPPLLHSSNIQNPSPVSSWH